MRVPAKQRTPRWALPAAAAGAVFAILAQTQHPTLSYAGDGALVLADQVSYPPDAVMNQNYLGSWTLLHQLGAILLEAGAGYFAMNYVLLCLAPAVLMMALTMIAFTGVGARALHREGCHRPC